jgi:flagellar protein FliJ
VRRFQFRLERFLELRRWKERQWEIALAKILGACLNLERRITEIGEEIGASRLVGYTDGLRIDVEAMARRELYVLRLARERERTREDLTIKRVELEKVRASYLEAARERKVLDKLKERRSGEYYDRQIDEEFKTADDMNSAAAVNALRKESAEYRGSKSAEYRGGKSADELVR